MLTMDIKMKIYIGLIAMFALGLIVAGSMFYFGGGQDKIYVGTNSEGQVSGSVFVSRGLEYNNTELVDHRYYITDELCLAGNLGMNISIYPCVANAWDGTDINHEVEFSWNGGSPQNTSWVFVYEGQLDSGQMLLGTLVNKTVEFQNTEERYITNFLINGVVNYTDVSPPVLGQCDLGTENNTQMYDLTQDTINGTINRNICFSQVTPVNATAFRVSGNATVTFTDTYIKQVKRYNTPVSVEYLGDNLLGSNFSYYRVQDVTFQPSQTYYTKWIFTPKDEANNGKWHIFGYDSNLQLTEAIDLGQYIYVDPAWTANLDDSIGFYYRMNDTASPVIDYVQGQNATDTGTLTYSQPGIIDESIEWDGSGGDYLTVPNKADLDSDSFTISTWLYADVQSANARRLWTTSGGIHLDAWYSLVGGFFSYVSASGGTSQINYQANFTLGWNHLVTTYNDTTGNHTIYINGTAVNSEIISGTLSDGRDLWIGCFSGGCTGVRETYGRLDEFAYWSRPLTPSEVAQIWNNGDGIAYGQEDENSATISVLLLSPEDNLATNDIPINFSANQTTIGSYNNSNATLYIWNASYDILNQTTYSLTGNGTTTVSWNNSFSGSDGNYDWNVYGCGVNETGGANCTFASSNFSFSVDTTSPIISLNANISDLVVAASDFPQFVTLNFSASDASLQSCWYYTSDYFPNTTFTCNTTTQVNFSSAGYKYIYYYANDSAGQKSNSSVGFDIGVYSAWENVDPIGEGQEGIYTLEINKTGVESQTLNSSLRLNNSNYSYDSLTLGTDTVSFATNVVIPDGWGSTAGNIIYWNYSFSIDGVNYTTATQDQTVVEVTFDDCSSYGTQILNLTHYDEATRTLINTSAGSYIELDLEVVSLLDSNFTVQYSNTWTDDAEAIVCVPDGLLNNSEYRIDFVVEYGATDHVVEFFYLDNGTLDTSEVLDSLTNKTIALYDLELDDSTTFLFSFLDEDNLEVPEAIVHVFRQYIGDGIFEEVERSKQDDNGETHIHLVEEDVIYYFKISLNGLLLYTSSTYNAKCLSTPCSIEIEASADFVEFPTDWDLFDGGSYSVTNNPTTRNVYLAFTSATPQTMNLTIAKQDYDGDVTIVGSSQATATSGNLSVAVPATAGNVTYYAIVYESGSFLAYSLVDFNTTPTNYGATGNGMGFLLAVALILMGASEGLLLYAMIVVSLILIGALALFKISYYALAGVIAAIAILLYKAVKRGRSFR